MEMSWIQFKWNTLAIETTNFPYANIMLKTVNFLLLCI